MHGLFSVAEPFLRSRGPRVLLLSEHSSVPEGNLKTLQDRMLLRGMDRSCRMRLSFRDVRLRSRHPIPWLKAIFDVARNDVVFIDNFSSLFSVLRPAPGTKLIQVWHAGLGFKNVGWSRFGMPGSPYPASRAHRSYSTAVAPDASAIPVYAEAFGMHEADVLPVGLLRAKPLLRAGTSEIRTARDSVLNWAGERAPVFSEGGSERRLYLFAPTYRGSGKSAAYYDHAAIDWQRLHDFLGKDSALLVRMHPYVTQSPPIDGLDANIVDVSAYPDVGDLLLAADVLITDYSSICYDFALLRRPILFYTYDEAVYALTRGMHRSTGEGAPGKVCASFEALIRALEEEDYAIERTLALANSLWAEVEEDAAGDAADRLLEAVLGSMVAGGTDRKTQPPGTEGHRATAWESATRAEEAQTGSNWS
jgi:CDP-ribitol ribitolphosphotransferase